MMLWVYDGCVFWVEVEEFCVELFYFVERSFGFYVLWVV